MDNAAANILAIPANATVAFPVGTLLDRWGNPVSRKMLADDVAAPTLTGVRSPLSGYPADGLNPVRLASILRAVHDGDTVTLDIDLGFRQWTLGRSVRLHGLDAPELRGAERVAGLASRDFLRELCPPGTALILESLRDRTEKYGRLLGRLYLADGRCVNDLMLQRGLAR